MKASRITDRIAQPNQKNKALPVLGFLIKKIVFVVSKLTSASKILIIATQMSVPKIVSISAPFLY